MLQLSVLQVLALHGVQDCFLFESSLQFAEWHVFVPHLAVEQELVPHAVSSQLLEEQSSLLQLPEEQSSLPQFLELQLAVEQNVLLQPE